MLYLSYDPSTQILELKDSFADSATVIRTIEFVKPPEYYDQKKRVRIYASIEDQGLIFDLAAESVHIEYPANIESEDSPV